MGSFFSRLFSRLDKERRLLMLGLDASGKTTILYKMQLGEAFTTVPTIGFNVETLVYKNLNMTIWDVGGQTKIRPLWRHYYENTDALVYVVDSSDQDRMDEAAEELHHILADDTMRHAALLVFANKMDLPGAIPVKALTERLKLNEIRSRQWFIQGTTAISGDGLNKGMDWLVFTLNALPPR